MKSIGYSVHGQGLMCDAEEAQKRNQNRGDDNISAYFTEHYQRKWLINAAVSGGAENPL
jgi:hypothetical protein